MIDQDYGTDARCWLCQTRTELICIPPAAAAHPTAPRTMIRKCTKKRCGYWFVVYDREQLLEPGVVAILLADSPPWREGLLDRLARRIAPMGWYRHKAAPMLPRALADRLCLDGLLLLDALFPPRGDATTTGRGGLWSWLRWRTTLAGWQLANRTRRTTRRLDSACAELVLRAGAAEAAARERKDGQI